MTENEIDADSVKRRCCVDFLQPRRSLKMLQDILNGPQLADGDWTLVTCLDHIFSSFAP
jgi:hypothetical protein